MKILHKETSKYYVKKTNKETGLITEEVFDFQKDAAKILIMINDDNMEIEKGFVADDTPLGIVGNAKMLKIHKDRRNLESIQINYTIENGVPRFKDFKPIQLDKVKLCKDATNDGDLLKIVPDNQGITLVDITEMNNLRYLIRSVQQFNEALLLETDDNNDDNEENNDVKPVEEKTGHTYNDLKNNKSGKDDKKDGSQKFAWRK